MKAVIRGTDKRAKELRGRLTEQGIQVIGLCGRSEGMSVLSAVDIYKKGECSRFFIPSGYTNQTIRDMVKELCAHQVRVEDIQIGSDADGKVQRAEDFLNARYLDYLEFHVCDHCNMNCAGCSHFSPLVKGERTVPLETVKNDLTRLHELIEEIDLIRILGGEPLLNEDLAKYIAATREIYPRSRIVLTTNGLLIEKMDSRLIEQIKNAGIVLEFTLYRPLINRAHDILEFLRDHEIEYLLKVHGVVEFDKPLVERPRMSKAQARRLCPTNCRELYNGKLFHCPMAAFIGDYNDYFQKDLPAGEGLNLYDDITYDEILEFFERPIGLCEFCALPLKERRQIAWKQFDESEDSWTL